MAKWTSPVLTDIRNQVGKSVVFSAWKGRGYFRSYIKPVNPRTLKQQANREVHGLLVKRWQEIATSESIKAEWNNVGAQEGNITGYNVFVKYGRKSKISCVASATVNSTITITYTLGLPAAFAFIAAIKPDNTLEIVAPPGTLEAGEGKTVTYRVSSAGTYQFFIADSRVLVSGDTPPKNYQLITKWMPDYATGKATAADCVVS